MRGKRRKAKQSRGNKETVEPTTNLSPRRRLIKTNVKRLGNQSAEEGGGQGNNKEDG